MTRVAFLGSKATGLRVLTRLLDGIRTPHEFIGAVCPEDRADARSELAQFTALSANRFPLLIAASPAEAERALLEWRPDVVFVANWYWILPVQRLAPTEFFGFHYSLLPHYRGNAPLVWQIIRGEPETGVSLFRFGAGVDDGDLVAQARLPLTDEADVGSLLAELNERAAQLLAQHLAALLDHTLVLRPQDDSAATYAGLRVPEDGLIDWGLSARQVHDFVRAQTRPYPGAFTTLPDGRLLRVWRTAVDPRPYVGVPGAVAERHADHVVVTCGEGAVRLLEVGLDGVDGMPPNAVLRSVRTRLGSKPRADLAGS